MAGSYSAAAFWMKGGQSYGQRIYQTGTGTYFNGGRCAMRASVPIRDDWGERIAEDYRKRGL